MFSICWNSVTHLLPVCASFATLCWCAVLCLLAALSCVSTVWFSKQAPATAWLIILR